MPAFQFVNTSKPGENLSAANRKLVRSNATLQRSKKRRRANLPKNGCDEQIVPSSTPITMQMSPFSVSMQKNVYAILEYQERVVGPSLFPWKALHELSPAHRILMCMALQDERVLYSAVAIASHYLLNTEVLTPCESKQWQVVAFGHQQRAIELIKERFLEHDASHMDVGTALSMMNLASLELISLSETGWSIHMDALRRMTDSSDGKSAVCTARFTVFDVDLLGCYMFDRQPNFDVEELEPEVLTMRSNEMLTMLHPDDQEERDLSPNFCLNFLEDDLTRTIERMRNLNKFIAEASPARYSQMHVQAYVVARFSIEYTLFKILGQDGVNSSSRVACFAAQIYTNRIYRTFSQNSEIPHRIAGRLKKALLQLLEEDIIDGQQSTLILWAAILGGIGARSGPLRQFFVSTISAICKASGLATWNQVFDTLRSMVWCEKCLFKECQALWSEVEAVIDHALIFPHFGE